MRGHSVVKNDEWLTPPKLIELARQVMDGIDTDPTSNDIAQQNVKASSYYTNKDGALSKSWIGNFWLNLPFSREIMFKFSSKLLAEIKNGNTKQAIMLT